MAWQKQSVISGGSSKRHHDWRNGNSWQLMARK